MNSITLLDKPGIVAVEGVTALLAVEGEAASVLTKTASDTWALLQNTVRLVLPLSEAGNAFPAGSDPDITLTTS